MNNNKVLILLFCVIYDLCISCHKTQPQGTTAPVPPAKIFYNPATFVMGADLSYINQVQDYGGVYKDSNTVKDPFIILKTMVPMW
jgi:arabinogalactan endo-1,4-beta-galactosidase